VSVALTRAPASWGCTTVSCASTGNLRPNSTAAIAATPAPGNAPACSFPAIWSWQVLATLIYNPTLMAVEGLTMTRVQPALLLEVANTYGWGLS